jgi:hypothetical protein
MLSSSVTRFAAFLLCVTIGLGQDLEIEKIIDVAPGVTTTFSPILIKNNEDDHLDIKEINIEILNTKAVKWDPDATAKSISTELYKKKIETRKIFNWNFGRHLKWIGVSQLLGLFNLVKYDYEPKEHSVTSSLVLNDGATIKLKYESDNFAVWQLAPNQGIRISNIPIFVDEDVENQRTQVRVSLKLSDKRQPIEILYNVELNPFLPHSEFLGDYKNHLSIVDKRKHKGVKNRKNRLPDLQIACPNSSSMFEAEDRIYLELKDTDGRIRWSSKDGIHIIDGDGNEVMFSQGVGRAEAGVRGEGRFTVINVVLLKNVRSNTLHVKGLAIEARDRSRPIIGSYPIEIAIQSGGYHRFTTKQEIMFGNPVFIGPSDPIHLYPDQDDEELPQIAIKEDSSASLITSEHGIRLKIVDKIDYGTHKVDLTNSHFIWANEMLRVEYSGSAASRMVPVSPSITSDVIHLQVREDFNPGDDLEIIGLQVQTQQNPEQNEYTIVASYDGGNSYFDVNGMLAEYPGKVNIYNPTINYNSGQKTRYLIKGKPQPLGEISITNNGDYPLFENGNDLIINLNNNIGTTWSKESGAQPRILMGQQYVERISYLTMNDEILLKIKKSLPPDQSIAIGGIGLKDFKKRGRSTFSLSFLESRETPIAETTSTIEVTTPLINSLYSQILTKSDPVQKLSGIKLASHEELGFNEEGVIMSLPQEMPLTWNVGKEFHPRLYSGGILIQSTVSVMSSQKLIHIRPTKPAGPIVYIHNLGVNVLPIEAAYIDTGKIKFSFNQGHSYSNRDEHLLRIIEPQDKYSIDIKKYETISSNMSENDEPISFFLSAMPGERLGPNNIEFFIAEDCSLRTSADYYHPRKISRQSSDGKIFRLKGDSDVEAPGAAMIVNNLRVSGLRERMRKLRIGVAIHNYSGMDTIYTTKSLYDLAQNVVTVKPKREDRHILPDVKITGGTWEKDGPSVEHLVLKEIKILNPIMSATENNRIQVLSESNINNIRTYISIHDFEEAEKKINRIIRHSNKYWIGYWLQHQLQATQNNISDARSAIAEAERYGWVSSNSDFPKHLELIASPIERARFHYRTAVEKYNSDRIWEADSIVTLLRSNYVVSGLLDTVDGGRDLSAQILNLGAELSTEFNDYMTASKYYYDASFYVDNYEHYEGMSDAAAIIADSLYQPYTGDIITELLPPSEIVYVIKNPFANYGSLILSAPGMTNYPVLVAKQRYKMDEVISIQGGVNYRIEPQPLKEEFRRLGAAVLLATGILGVTYYNQGF